MFIFKKKSVIDESCNLNEILENCKDIVFFYNPENFECIYANKEAVESLGYSQDKLLGSKPSLYDYGFRDLGMINAILKPLLAGENQTVKAKSNYKSSNGKILPVEISFSMTEINNKPVIVAIAHNLFYKKFFEDSARNTSILLEQQSNQKNKAFLQEHQFLNSIIENLPFAIWLKDADNRYRL